MDSESKDELDVLDHLQRRFAALPPGTVLVPPGVCRICQTNPCNAANHYFGVCPMCHKTDGYLNVGNMHVFLCHEHKKAWAIGANLFSSAMDETLEQQLAEEEKIGFSEYEEVEPYFDLRAAETDDHKGDDSLDLKEALDAEDMSEGVEAVKFGDPQLMIAEDALIEGLLNGYPYRGFDDICRKLRLPPAEALKRILPFAEGKDAECIAEDAEKLIEEGWEPGEPPTETMTDKPAMFAMLDANFEIQLDACSKWTRGDVAFRMGLSYEAACRLLFDYLVTWSMINATSMSGLSHDEARQLLPTCDYMLELPAMHAVWKVKSDLLRTAFKAEAAKRPKPTMAERHEQAARVIEEMEG